MCVRCIKNLVTYKRVLIEPQGKEKKEGKGEAHGRKVRKKPHLVKPKNTQATWHAAARPIAKKIRQTRSRSSTYRGGIFIGEDGGQTEEGRKRTRKKKAASNSWNFRRGT